MRSEICSHPGCPDSAVARGMCFRHAAECPPSRDRQALERSRKGRAVRMARRLELLRTTGWTWHALAAALGCGDNRLKRLRAGRAAVSEDDLDAVMYLPITPPARGSVPRGQREGDYRANTAASYIRELHDRGVPFREISKELGIHPNSLSRWVSGHRGASEELIDRVFMLKESHGWEVSS